MRKKIGHALSRYFLLSARTAIVGALRNPATLGSLSARARSSAVAPPSIADQAPCPITELIASTRRCRWSLTQRRAKTGYFFCAERPNERLACGSSGERGAGFHCFERERRRQCRRQVEQQEPFVLASWRAGTRPLFNWVPHLASQLPWSLAGSGPPTTAAPGKRVAALPRRHLIIAARMPSSRHRHSPRCLPSFFVGLAFPLLLPSPSKPKVHHRLLRVPGEPS